MVNSGKRQLGNYLLTHLLGRGGFADVYYGEHIYLNTPAAIKVLNVQITSQEHEKFLLEAQIAARLEHPHIISILEFGVENQIPYLVMDYAANGSLRQHYPKGTRLSLAQIVSYVQQIASALQYTHEQHLVHRDIKPENMLLSNNDTVLLSDFGIALVVQNAQSATSKQRVVGTIAYMAPEQLRGEPSAASDQYALGAVIYEWLCGTPPFYGSYTEIAVQHALIPPPPLHTRLPEIPSDVAMVVSIALAKDPLERFKSIKEFATAFIQACDIHATQSTLPFKLTAGPPALVNQKRPLHQRLSRRTVTLALLGGTALVVGGTLAWQPLSQQLRSLLAARPTPKPAPLTAGTTLYTHHGPTIYGRETFAWSRDSHRIISVGSQSLQLWDTNPGKLEKVYENKTEGSSYSSIVAWSPDNQYVAMGLQVQASSSQAWMEVWVWEVTSGKNVTVYRPQGADVGALAWSPDNKFLAASLTVYTNPASGSSMIVSVWEVLTGKSHSVYQGHTSTINALAWSPSGTLLASADTGNQDENGLYGAGTVHVWEVASGQTRLIYHGHSGSVNAVNWSPDGKLIASGSGSHNYGAQNPDNNTVQIWEPTSSKTLLIYRGHSTPLTAVAWSPTGELIVSGSSENSDFSTNDALVQIWNASNGNPILSYWGHNQNVESGVGTVGWSPDGKLMASADYVGTIQVWVAPDERGNAHGVRN